MYIFLGIAIVVGLLWWLFSDGIDFDGCLALLLEMGLELLFLSIAFVIALVIYHALFGR
jgi:hypothetical protein